MQKSNLFQYVLVALLIAGAFYIGSLRQKVILLEKNQGTLGANDTNVVDNTPTEAPFNVADLSKLAKSAGLNVSDFEKCLNSDEAKKEVSDQQDSGVKAGVQGTPGIFLLDNQTGNIAVAPGAVPYEMLKTMMDKMIAGLTDADKKADPSAGIQYTDKTKLQLDPISGTDYVRGNAGTRFALIDYSDYDCPFCKKFHPTAQKLLSEYKDKVNWVYRQFPLDQLHPNARIKSQAARCAGKLGGGDAFWKFTDALTQE